MNGSHPTESATPRGLLIIISGPSGVGKTTIVHRVKDIVGAAFSVSMTTRAKTDKDTEGKDYFFVDRAAFESKRANGALLESAEFSGNLYGTPRAPVEDALKSGKLMILEIEVEGAKQVKANLPEAQAVFILPPDEDTLLQRLRDRKREGEEAIQRRFAEAKREIAEAKTCGAYDHFVVNEKLDDAVSEVVGWIEALRSTSA